MEPTFFNAFVAALASGTFDFSNDTLAVALVAEANAPVVGNSELADLTLIDTTNLASNVITTTSSGQTGGVYTLGLANTALEASGGNVGPFRYAVIYNDTAAGDPLICWFDLSADVTIPDTQTVTLVWEDGGLLDIQAT